MKTEILFDDSLRYGGTIINFGSLESNIGANIYSLVPNNLALKSVSIMSWFRLAEDEKRKDFDLALSLESPGAFRSRA